MRSLLIMLIGLTICFSSFSQEPAQVERSNNKVIIETETFTITTGEVIDLLFTNFGPRAGDLKKLPADRIKKIVETNAEQLAMQKLLLNAANEMGLKVPETYVGCDL